MAKKQNNSAKMNSVVKGISAKSLFGAKPKGKYKFLNLTARLTGGSIVFNWAVEGVGFGQLSFYIADLSEYGLPNGIRVDDETMGQDFATELLQEAWKRYKKGSLEVKGKVTKELLLNVASLVSK